METLLELIIKYYKEKQLKLPDVWEAMAFVNTEIAEVYELLLARNGGWLRNHPENKPEFNIENLGEELGDCIFMLMVAGYVEGINPIESLKNKLNRKLEKINEKN